MVLKEIRLKTCESGINTLAFSNNHKKNTMNKWR